MSAFLVSKTHVDALITAGLSRRISGHHGPLHWYQEGKGGQLFTHDRADEVGRTLWLENLASVAARYPNDASGERPGPCDLTDEQIAAYEFTRLPGTPEPVIVLAALKCFEYQSCEHDRWQTSEAKAFCDSLRDACIRALPGYDDAPWEITDPNIFQPTNLSPWAWSGQ